MLTRIINLMGAYFGPEHIQFNPDGRNSKGYWERKDVVQANEHILSISGSTWYSPNTQDCTAIPLPTSLNHTLQSLILGMDAHRPWVMKDPRLCLTLPYWMEHLESPVIVFCARHPGAVARSLYSRNRMPNNFSLALWEFYVTKALKVAPASPRVHVAYEDFLRNPISATKILFEKLKAVGLNGIRMPHDREITEFLSANWVPTQGKEEVTLSRHRQQVYEALCGKNLKTSYFEPSDETLSLISQAYAGALFG